MGDLTSWISQQEQEYQRKRSAWLRAKAMPGYNPDRFRRDAYGTLIAWDEYGNRSMYGWEIDHELPKSLFPGLAAQPFNLRALHWRNNRVKSDKIDMSSLNKLLGGLQ